MFLKVVEILPKHMEKISKGDEMNSFFNKALYCLDKENYEEGENLLKKAIETCNNSYEIIQIQACYAEVLYEMNKIKEAEECISYVLENSSQEKYSYEREIVCEILEKIRGNI